MKRSLCPTIASVIAALAVAQANAAQPANPYGTSTPYESCVAAINKNAAEAFEIGLVNRVVEPDELLPAALSIAERIAANPWRAVEAAKQALRASWQQDLAGALNFGFWTAGALHWTDDFQGRVADFVDRKSKE